MTLVWFFIIQTLWASPQKGIYFYRSPQSQFPSGQTAVDTLFKKQVGTSKEYFYFIKKDQYQGWITADTILTDQNLVTKPSESAQQQMNDLGLVFNLIASTLREQPDLNSNTLSYLKPMTKMEFVKMAGTWVQVNVKEGSKTLTGFIDSNNVVTRFDFASFVLNEKNQWRPVKFRESDKLILDQNESVSINSIRFMATKKNLGIVCRNTIEKLPMKSNIEIVKSEIGIWNISELKGHGEVFWKNEIAKSELKSEFSKSLSTNDILKLEINSASFSTTDSKIGVVSADAVYITTDGEHWTALNQFGQTHPQVAVGPKNEIIIGSQISYDNGKSFQNFLKWENMTKLIEGEAKKPAHSLMIKDIAFINSKQVKLTLNTGHFNIDITGNPSDMDSWRLMK